MQKLGRNEPCWCGSGKKYKHCHCEFDEKLEEFEFAGSTIPTHDLIKTPEQIEKINETPYYYYALDTKAETRQHHFSKTLDEHNSFLASLGD